MRIFATAFAIVVLAAAPCAWDSDPGEPSLLAALVAIPASATAAARPQPAAIEDGGLLPEAPHEELANPFFD
ncbi:hypothetical protein IB265_13405 [Ensifer sp. ENS10]|uniref:hypothetical protein n=1 Tax=unclassified Ensifer TaxID=2633371 RepID=UPI00070D2413|nr:MULTISPECIES: hypothetical protein [unclassified Ensifer]KRD72013.1 hypothetical protein ASE60_22375 [Ensifer sp. Root278]MBD9507779.1 hypothetical protein [Ensifer sp. ENS10]MBV7518699.1 hypothetical protein [Ensifer sp. ENS12]